MAAIQTPTPRKRENGASPLAEAQPIVKKKRKVEAMHTPFIHQFASMLNEMTARRLYQCSEAWEGYILCVIP